jgi:hypothetical protein
VPLSLQTKYGCLKVSDVAFTQAEHRSLTKIAQRVESEESNPRLETFKAAVDY